MDVEIKRDGLILRGILTKPTTATFNLVIIFHGFRGYKEDPLLEKIAILPSNRSEREILNSRSYY